MSLKKKAVKLAAKRIHPALPLVIWAGGKAYRIYRKKREKKNDNN